MTQVKPFIKCVDYWKTEIPPNKLKAYKQLITEGQIMKHQVLYNEKTGSTIVEYFAIAPHEWILDTLRERAESFV